MFLDRNLLANGLFDITQKTTIFRRAEGDGLTRSTSTGGTANAVDIGLRHKWQVVVEDVGDAINVDAAGGNIGCHEGQHLAGLEARQRALFAIGLATCCRGSPLHS